MGWSSAMVLRLEQSQIQTQAQAALEENARLALWRMDSTLTALVAQESARPYFHYSAYYSAAGPYTNMFARSASEDALIPSPLLRDTPKQIVLHFQLGPAGSITSPQVPSGAWRAKAIQDNQVRPAALAQHATRLREIQVAAQQASFAHEVERAALTARASATPAPTPAPTPESLPAQKLKNFKEFDMRQQSFSQTNSSVIPNQQAQPVRARAVPVEEGTMEPQWVGDALLLVRRVRVNGVLYVQGCWMDWPLLQSELLTAIQDLLPNARLEHAAATATPGADDERRLATIPVRLVPGTIAAAVGSASPIRLSLAGAWACLLLAAIAVAALLRGVMTLSERRRVFVSAVTHELRTPLTTFRLYTDMLAEGMVPEDKRTDYFGRLRAEAERLGHLVENVLFYARLESGRAGAVRESVDLVATVREIAERLQEGARKSGMTLVIEARAHAVLRARVDRSALEQILVNLVDNACKYASAATKPEIRIEIEHQDQRALVRVRDQGPGLSPAERRRLFRPFSKSDREAANSAPGVGLGLALSRRLARAQGGDLRLDTAATPPGATFVLSLPLEGARPS
jgi:signal transduction histidine kinase